MSILRRFLGIAKPDLNAEPHLAERYRETTAQLLLERQEFRQKVQNVESGAKIMRTWDDALEMVTRGRQQ